MANDDRITTFPYTSSYDEMASRIATMSQVIKDYRDDYDIVKVSEAVEHKMRSGKTIKLLETNVLKSVGNIAGSVAVDTFFGGNLKNSLTRAAIREARSTLLGRAVGPLESLPVADYVQDRYRALNVTTSTQTGPEHRWMAKLMQKQAYDNGRGITLWNKSLMENDLGNQATGAIEQETLPQPLALRSLSDEERRSARVNSEFAVRKVYETKSNTWHQKNEYTDSSHGPVANNGEFNFIIKNLASGVIMPFPAYIDSISEGSSPTWGSISLINRSEDIYVYERAERSFDMDFWVFATNNDPDNNPYRADHIGSFPTRIDVTNGTGYTSIGVMTKKMMWDRINFLHTVTRPAYGAGGVFSMAPYCRLTVGDLFKNMLVIFEDVSISYDELVWDLNVDTKSKDGIKPMMAKITVNGKILHDSAPSVETDFYKRDI
jgi:hypothetical protein